MNLPVDLIKIILNYLPIIDKRNLIRSCQCLNQLYPLIKYFEKEFMELLNTTNFVSNKPINLNQCEIYALEYIYYDREDIPDKYLEHNKILLTKYPLLYVNMAGKRSNICKKIYHKYSKHINKIMKGAILGGNLQMVKWVFC